MKALAHRAVSVCNIEDNFSLLLQNLAMPKPDEHVQLNRLVRKLSSSAAEEYDVQNHAWRYGHVRWSDTNYFSLDLLLVCHQSHSSCVVFTKEHLLVGIFLLAENRLRAYARLNFHWLRLFFIFSACLDRKALHALESFKIEFSGGLPMVLGSSCLCSRDFAVEIEMVSSAAGGPAFIAWIQSVERRQAATWAILQQWDSGVRCAEVVKNTAK